jgi:hypothetical protein
MFDFQVAEDRIEQLLNSTYSALIINIRLILFSVVLLILTAVRQRHLV